MSGTVYDQLVDAGAPALTGSDFYRITEHNSITTGRLDLRVQIRRPRKHLGSDARGTGWVIGFQDIATVADGLPEVVRACRRAHELAELTTGSLATVNHFVGRHP